MILIGVDEDSMIHQKAQHPAQSCGMGAGCLSQLVDGLGAICDEVGNSEFGNDIDQLGIDQSQLV